MQKGIPRTGQILDRELERLQRLLDSGYDLRVSWMPRSDSALEGEVKSDVIFIYSECEEDAVQTLRHEFLDFLVSQATEPYNELVNAQRLVITGLLDLIQEKAYQWG